MFSSPPAVSRASGFANAYRQVGAETAATAASPHQLITLLFEGALEAIAQARGALRDRRVEAKGKAISRAARIVGEGLRGGLNLNDGGKLAADLDDLYGYIVMRLTMANLRNDEAALDECQRLLQPLLDAWKSIAGNAGPAAAR